MSTVPHRPPVRPPDPPGGPDPFHYGGRDVHIIRPDGTEELDRVPLTLEDVLHPEVGIPSRRATATTATAPTSRPSAGRG
jgi:hypothetical protein